MDFYRVLFPYTLRNFTTLSIYKSYMNTSFKTLILFSSSLSLSLSLSFSLLLSLSLSFSLLFFLSLSLSLSLSEICNAMTHCSARKFKILFVRFFREVNAAYLRCFFPNPCNFCSYEQLHWSNGLFHASASSTFRGLSGPQDFFNFGKEKAIFLGIGDGSFFRTNNSISLPLFYISNALGSRSFCKNRVIPLRVFLCILKRHVIYTLE